MAGSADNAKTAGVPPARWRLALRRLGWAHLALAAVVVLAGIIACNKVWDSDAFWHLRSGQWMLDHGRILDHDPFSLADAPPGAGDAAGRRWVNVYWLFQIVIAGLHALGGFAALSVLQMLVFAATISLLAWHLRTRVPAWWLMLSLAALALAAESRVRLRPEIVTFLLLAATIVLLERTREDGCVRRLWWLAAVNVLWVNMHGLFVLGLAAAWAAWAGAMLDRWLRREVAQAFQPVHAAQPGKAVPPLATLKALPPLVGATLACLISPWPIEAAIHPLTLLSRLGGHGQVYSFGVSELLPTWRVNPLDNGPVLACLLLVLAAGQVMLLRSRRVPAGHWLWLVIFAAAGASALRNIAIAAIVAGYLLALHAGTWLTEAADRRAVWRHPVTRAVATLAVLGLLQVLALAFIGEGFYRWQHRPANQFGLGLALYAQPADMGDWLRFYGGQGDILPLDFGDGGPLMFFCPTRKVWMDGRLELHSGESFLQLYEYRMQLLSPRQGQDPATTPLPPSVRFIVVRGDDFRRINALANMPERFELVYIDPAGVCFGRRALPGENVTWSGPLPGGNMGSIDHPLPRPHKSIGSSDRAYAAQARTESARYWRLGAILYALGLDNLAVRYLAMADCLSAKPDPAIRRLLAQAHQRLAEAQPIVPDRDLPVDPNLARALAIYNSTDLSDLRDPDVRDMALNKVRALIADRQADAALAAVEKLLAELPLPLRWEIQLPVAASGTGNNSSFDAPPEDLLSLRDRIAQIVAAARQQADAVGLAQFQPAERALILTKLQLIDAAVAELEAAKDLPPAAQLLLGDLYLRKGLPERARKPYEQGGVERWYPSRTDPIRSLLEHWIGAPYRRSWVDRREVSLLASAATSSTGEYLYCALILEQLGDYYAARSTLSDVDLQPLPSDTQLRHLLERTRLRLGMPKTPPATATATSPAGASAR